MSGAPFDKSSDPVGELQPAKPQMWNRPRAIVALFILLAFGLVYEGCDAPIPCNFAAGSCRDSRSDDGTLVAEHQLLG
jgi:hypothetical protein